MPPEEEKAHQRVSAEWQISDHWHFWARTYQTDADHPYL